MGPGAGIGLAELCGSDRVQQSAHGQAIAHPVIKMSHEASVSHCNVVLIEWLQRTTCDCS
jgi:hypothetical protein